MCVCVRVSFFMGGVLCDPHNLSALQLVIALYCLYVLFPQFLATPRCSLVRLSLPVEICIVVASCVRVNVFTFFLACGFRVVRRLGAMTPPPHFGTSHASHVGVVIICLFVLAAFRENTHRISPSPPHCVDMGTDVIQFHRRFRNTVDRYFQINRCPRTQCRGIKLRAKPAGGN